MTAAAERISAHHGAATAKANDAICTEVDAGAAAVTKAAAAMDKAVSAKVDAAAAIIYTVFA